MIGKLDPEENVLNVDDTMQLTPEMINRINELMAHKKKDGTVNWKKDEEYEVCIAGTFAADRFIVIHNRSKKPWVPANPHPDFDYESKTFRKSKGIPAPEDIA